MIRIMLVGGGSGGHFYPLIAVAQRLRAYTQQIPLELYYMGPELYDEESIRTNSITFVRCPAGKRRKYFSFLNYLDIFKVFYGFFVALWKLFIIYPDVIFSKGSYTSVPVVFAAAILRIPIVVHESDAKAGSANKLAGKFARYVAISFNEAATAFAGNKVAKTGVPIRMELLTATVNPGTQLGLPETKPLLFVTGGSFGAQRINTLILESLDELLPYYTIFHQTGGVNEQAVRLAAASLPIEAGLLEGYFIKGNLSAQEMNLALSAASLVISRAGSGTIFEIAQKGAPAILIPIPEPVSHDQKTNAYAYASTGAATVIEESNLTDSLLASEIHRIMDNQEVYMDMKAKALTFYSSDAAVSIAQTLIGIAEEHA